MSVELIPQPNGRGAIWPPSPGHHGAAANRLSFRALRKIMHRLLAEGSPKAIRKLMRHINSDDERVSVMACVALLNAAQKMGADATGSGGDADDDRPAPELHRLSAPDLQRMAEALRVVRELRGKVGPVVDAEVE